MLSIALENIDYRSEIKRKTAKPLLWIGLVSIIMFFGGLTSAVIVSKSGADWIKFQVPSMFLVSTFIIIASSFVYQIALISIKKDNLKLAKPLISVTLLLGVSFAISQYIAWAQLYHSGVFWAGDQSNPAGSYFYALTGLHLLHVLGGLISLIVVLVKTLKEKYNAKNLLGVQLSITYWHFLGGLWIYLYFFLRFVAL